MTLSTAVAYGSGMVPGQPPDTRERLVRAAWDLLGEGGPGAVTLRGVGARVGLSRSAPYRHFTDKDALLRAVAARAFLVMRDRMRAAADGARDTPSALRAVLLAYIDFAGEAPEHYRLMFGEWVVTQKKAEGATGGPLHEAAVALFDECAGMVASGQREGAFRAGDPGDLALLTWSTVHGLVTFAGTGHLDAKDRAARAEVERLVGEVVKGLLARSAG